MARTLDFPAALPRDSIRRRPQVRSGRHEVERIVVILVKRDSLFTGLDARSKLLRARYKHLPAVPQRKRALILELGARTSRCSIRGRASAIRVCGSRTVDRKGDLASLLSTQFEAVIPDGLVIQRGGLRSVFPHIFHR